MNARVIQASGGIKDLTVGTISDGGNTHLYYNGTNDAKLRSVSTPMENVVKAAISTQCPLLHFRLTGLVGPAQIGVGYTAGAVDFGNAGLGSCSSMDWYASGTSVSEWLKYLRSATSNTGMTTPGEWHISGMPSNLVDDVCTVEVDSAPWVFRACYPAPSAGAGSFPVWSDAAGGLATEFLWRDDNNSRWVISATVGSTSPDYYYLIAADPNGEYQLASDEEVTRLVEVTGYNAVGDPQERIAATEFLEAVLAVYGIVVYR